MVQGRVRAAAGGCLPGKAERRFYNVNSCVTIRWCTVYWTVQLSGSRSLGSYCCLARNCMGEAASTAALTVEAVLACRSGTSNNADKREIDCCCIVLSLPDKRLAGRISGRSSRTAAAGPSSASSSRCRTPPSRWGNHTGSQYKVSPNSTNIKTD